jgi:uncharacterized membrane protein
MTARSAFLSRLPPPLLFGFRVIALAVFAFALRHTGWNWDQGSPWSLHPDEMHMVTVTQALESEGGWLNTDESAMNPYNQGIHSYVYGTLPLKITHALTVDRGLTDRREILRIGRLLSALWSTGTVVLMYLLTARLLNLHWATISGIFMAITVLPIQQAHFYTVDSAGVFFATLCVGLGIIAAKENRNRLLLVSGSVVGLAMACRLNLGLLALWVTLTACAMAWNQKQIRPLLSLVGGGFLALILFRLCQPYAFDATGFWTGGLNPAWLKDIREVRNITHGTLEVPYTLQWVKRIPWLYAIGQILAWGMGWPLGILTFLGCGYLLISHRHTPCRWQLLLVLWPVILIGYHGGIFLHTLRYFLPAYPALILGGIVALRKLNPIEYRKLAVGGVLFLTALYCIAFITMYREPHPRVQASKWLFENLPYGGTVASEHWDLGLPLALKGAEANYRQFTFLELPVYDRESEAKIDDILQKIDEADYLVLSSTRASYTIPRMPLRYPVLTDFYTRLAEGKDRCGLEEVARFHRAPEINGWGLNTLKAEEAFRVYDHPLVRIYKKTPLFTVEALKEVLTENVDFDRIPQIPYTEAGKWDNGWLDEEDWEKRQSTSSLNDHFPPNGIGNQLPVATWSAALFFLGIGSTPLAFFLFPSLRDRGAGIARLLGLLLITFLAWFPAAIGLLPFGLALSIALLLVFGISSLLIGLHHEPLFIWLRRNYRFLIVGEVIFWSVFALFVALRMVQPDLWHPWAGGEKPMDFAFLNATALSPYFPPPQPWLSGGFINYYYYGFVLVASLIHTTGIAPEIAYNLALPTFAALAAGAVFTLATSWLPFFQTRKGWRGATAVGLVAVGLTLLAGNLGQLRWLMQDKSAFFSNAGYWNASRVIQVGEGGVQPITEFPFFSFLYGDLHAHIMALPLAVFALICSWQLYRHFHPLRILLCALALGSLWITNAWDFPVQAIMFLFLCGFGVMHVPASKKLSFLWSRLGWAILGLCAARMLFYPFHQKTLAHPAEFGLWTGQKSQLFDLILAHGLFLIPLVLMGGLFLTQKPKALRTRPLSSRIFWALCIGGCLFLMLFVEFFHLKSDIGRMNTVFKFYYQLWWILAICTAVFVTPFLRFSPREPLRLLFSIVAAIALTLGAFYPVTAVQAKLGERFWQTEVRGLDGMAYMKTSGLPIDGQIIPLQDDLGAIRWLQSNARPFEVVLEAHRPEYQWGSRISWHTGLPTVLGWNWHMRQQRPKEGADWIVWQRASDIQQAYTTTDPARMLKILQIYKVRYVISGQLEALTYGSDLNARLDSFPFLKPVWTSGLTTIYRVSP